MRADDGRIFVFLAEIWREMYIGGDVPIHIFVFDFHGFHILFFGWWFSEIEFEEGSQF
jgi:hypothetical protein